jgi:hypothetical protein
MGKKLWLLVGCTASIMALLTGCASQPQASQSPKYTASQTPSASASPTATPPAQAAADFAALMTASITTATTYGLTQNVTNSQYGVYTLVMDQGTNPKRRAAMRNPDGSIVSVLDADSFAPYFAQELVSAHAPVVESGQLFAVSKNIEGQEQEFVFVAKNGLLYSETMTDPSGVKVVSVLDYTLGQDAINILQAATK